MEFCEEDIERYKQEMRTYARKAGYRIDPPEADGAPPVFTPVSSAEREPAEAVEPKSDSPSEEEAAEPAAENPFGILEIAIGDMEEEEGPPAEEDCAPDEEKKAIP